ncbi:Ribonucleotide reductase of class III (anaerobic), activating protein [hydrothermal vent metagenome]|uniref:Ribonucleotide reductase of class III (Anaerobic), activating protein n=1 Tax=hydrothermal vent metagenome TaxID=652676 RepID=A0A3B0TV51_9ZZZZ
MKIGGFLKFSLIDYPGKIAAVIFTQGCNLRCPYCHNSELVVPDSFCDPLSQEALFDFLRRRQSQLEGVVITGGEPTIHRDLCEFLKEIKKLSYSIKLDTNGTNPFVIERVIEQNLVDFIAMDVKASFLNYSRAVGVSINVNNIKKSIRLIQQSNILYQFRTTIVDSWHSLEECQDIKNLINNDRRYVTQPFVPGDKVLDQDLNICNNVGNK